MYVVLTWNAKEVSLQKSNFCWRECLLDLPIQPEASSWLARNPNNTMAFRRSTLNEDLTLSDSDEEDVFSSSYSKNIDNLLADSDDERNAKESSIRGTEMDVITSDKQGAMSNTNNGNNGNLAHYSEREIGQATTSATLSNASNMENGVIDPTNASTTALNFCLERNGTFQYLASTSVRTRSRGLISNREVEDIDLDEVIRKRNIQAPPRAPRNKFHNDRPITGARRTPNVSREGMSLDEIIQSNKSFQQIPTVGRGGYIGRGRGMFNHSRQFPPQAPHHHRHTQQPNGNEQALAHIQNKLKLGLETIAESHGEANVLGNTQSHDKSSEFPKAILDPWFSIKQLNEKGYGTYCVLMKLKQEENLEKELAERMFKCIITYNDISGVCEAPFHYQAKHGAASDFVKKLCAQFPKIGPMPSKMSDEVLMNGSALEKLKTKLKALRKVDYTASFLFSSSSDSQGRVFFKCVLNIDPYKYEGSSSLSSLMAKFNAIKRAYEDLIKEPYPHDRIYIGEQECTTDSNLYRDLVSRKVHCYDFTRTTVYKPGTLQNHFQVRGSSRKSGRGSRGGRNGNVMVSIVEPKGCA